MYKFKKFLLIPIIVFILLSLYSDKDNKDLILELGKNRSIRLVDSGDDFYCDDPRYSNVRKIRKWTIQSSNGTKYLCRPEESDIVGYMAYLANMLRSLKFTYLSSDKRLVHAIGVYEGDYPDGNTHSAGYHPAGKIEVLVKNNPNANTVILLLMSYEPVNWNISVQKGTKIEKVILSDYEARSKISGITNIPVINKNLCCPYERDEILMLNEKVKSLVGVNIITAQGKYSGKKFEVF